MSFFFCLIQRIATSKDLPSTCSTSFYFVFVTGRLITTGSNDASIKVRVCGPAPTVCFVSLSCSKYEANKVPNISVCLSI